MTSPTDESPEPRKFDRRQVIGAFAAGAGAGWLATLAACVNQGRRARTTPTDGPAGRVLARSEWRTLDAALDVLLPSGPGSPGARDCNGIGYLDAALADRDTDPADADLVRRGVGWLDDAARAASASDFASATPAQREAAMRAIGPRDRGADWMTLMLAFGLESMLGDPVHGGNPGEVGWHWLGYQPGEPRPTGPTGPTVPASKAIEGPDPRGTR